MNFQAIDLFTLLPELVVLITACTVLIADLYLPKEERDNNQLITFAGLAAALAAVGVVGLSFGSEPTLAFGGAFIRDPMSDLLKGAVLVVTLLAFAYSARYMREREMWVGEFHVLVLFALLGIMVMISANGFLTMYLGLELLALCLYALVAFNRDSGAGAEAAMKYFVLGALGSGMLLYGVSMIYGATGPSASRRWPRPWRRTAWTTRFWCSGWCSCSSASLSSSVPCRFTCGFRMSIRARRRRLRCFCPARRRWRPSRWPRASWWTRCLP